MKFPNAGRAALRAARQLSNTPIVLAALVCAAPLCPQSPAQTNNAAPAEMPSRLLFPTNAALLPGKGPISSWKPFAQLWAKRRAEFWAHREQDKGAVVFLGDSITQGWSWLAESFPQLKTANRGIGGDTTRGLLYRLKEDVLDLEPAAVVLLIGTNDIGNDGNPEDAAANIALILDALKQSNPRMPIIVCKVMPSKKSVAPKIEKLNALVDEQVRDDRRLIPCDTWKIYASPDGTCYRGEFPDLLHPNKIGYEKWALALKPIFAGLNMK
ncbi:MAG TPA: GDSL-type esterase/lipase family protein [Verrucomicrobiae bacterium]|nr:GDSL-type esterase/lipase family protein [Verrucomicrobiae bacterium]